MLRIVLDTETPHNGIRPEAAPGPYMRLTDAALERAKAKYGGQGVDALSRELGFANRMVLWRARRGLYDIRLTQAVTIAHQLGLPLSKVFEGHTDA